MYKYFEGLPIWTYISILFAISVGYAVISKITNSYIPYIISIPVVFIVLTSFGYNTGLSALFSGLFVWRFISIRNKIFINNESNYLIITFLLTILALLVTQNFTYVMLLLTLIAVTLIGNTLSNLYHIESEKRNSFHRTEWIKWGGIFLGSAMLFFLLRDTLTKVVSFIWSGIGSVLTLVAGSFAQFLEYLGIAEFFQRGIDQMEPIEGTPGFAEGEEIKEYTSQPSEGIDMNTLIMIAIGVIALLLIYLIYRGMKEKAVENDQEEVTQYSIKEERLADKGNFVRTIFKRRRKSPNHPIRKLMFEFELKAAKRKLGRMHHESIENWFNRLGLEGNAQVYQKVRYGEKPASREEEASLKKLLNSLEKTLEEIKIEEEM